MSRSRYDVAGKVALVTGAAQGIGLALARELHRRGATVALLDIDSDACAQAAAGFGTDRALAVGTDVADRAAVAGAVAEVLDRTGRVDIAVANAGVSPKPATLRTMDPAEYDRVVAINQTGVFNTVQAVADAVIARGGHIVTVSSAAAFAPGPAGSPYMISKAAVEQLGRALRLELAPHGASAGVAYFGFVETPMATGMLDDDPLGRQLDRMLPWPLRRRVTAERAAKVVADGIARRAPRTMTPAAWQPYALLRGLVNVAADGLAARDPRVHHLIRGLENTAETQVSDPGTAPLDAIATAATRPRDL